MFASVMTADGRPRLPAQVYSLVGLCHFYHAATSGRLSRYATLGRAPAGTTGTELRAAVDGGTGLPVFPQALSPLLAGPHRTLINWRPGRR